MGEPVYIEPGETHQLIDAEDTQKKYLAITDSNVQLGRTESEARTIGRKAKAGDRGPMQTEMGEELHAHNPEESQNTARAHIDKWGFFWQREPRSVVGAVQTSSDNEAAPASDDYCWHWAIGVDISGGYNIPCDAPDRADTIGVSVDDANNTFEVAVVFEDDDGNEVTRIDKDDNADMQGDSATDSHTETLIFSPNVRVEITGAATSADISVYAR